VVRNDKIRIYSVETGEIVSELVDNVDGRIVGFYLNEELPNECLITCTMSGQVAFWKLKSFVITQKKVNEEDYIEIQLYSCC
jgi:hypothetical protein